jgi:hypothetical protein
MASRGRRRRTLVRTIQPYGRGDVVEVKLSVDEAIGRINRKAEAGDNETIIFEDSISIFSRDSSFAAYSAVPSHAETGVPPIRAASSSPSMFSASTFGSYSSKRSYPKRWRPAIIIGYSATQRDFVDIMVLTTLSGRSIRR